MRKIELIVYLYNRAYNGISGHLLLASENIGYYIDSEMKEFIDYMQYKKIEQGRN